MASVSEQVIEAFVALVTAALPEAEVERNQSKPASVPAGGMVIVRDGDPGEADIDLSPLSYNYAHVIPLDLSIYPSATLTAEARLDAMRVALAAAVMADRTLGGLCQFLDLQPGTSDDLEVAGAVAGRWAEVVAVARYASASPL